MFGINLYIFCKGKQVLVYYYNGREYNYTKKIIREVFVQYLFSLAILPPDHESRVKKQVENSKKVTKREQ